MVSDFVMLRRGTVLTAAHIARIKRLRLEEVLIELPGPGELQLDISPVELDARSLADDEQPTWMSQATFSQPVPLPELGAAERLLFARKQEIRTEAGLEPCIDPEREAELTKGVHATFIASAVSGEVDLDRLGELADQLSEGLQTSNGRYVGFTDVEQYGQVLAARSVLSSKIYSFSGFANGQYPMQEQLRGHLALANGFALMPASLSESGLAGVWKDKEALSQGLLRYYGWLRQQGFGDDDALEQQLSCLESHDGSGLPRGLSGDEIPQLSQNWSLAWHYSGQLLSVPSRPRVSPHQAAVGLVQQSGRAFSGAAVNGFLRRIGYYPVGSLVELSDDRLGLVVQQNRQALLKPVVRIVDSDGKVGKVLDLQQESRVFLSRQVMEY